VWCKAGDKPVVGKCRKTLKVHVYAGISYYGVTPLFFVHGTSKAGDLETSVTSKRYIEILNNCLLPSFQNTMEPHVANPVFQQDNASAHTSKETTTYLNSTGIYMLQQWPALSPDLSPIENAWAILQNKMDRSSIVSF
jgi:hypothetical protein